MAENRNGVLDHFNNWIMEKVAGPLGKFAQLKSVTVIREGLIAVMPVILIGSFFLLIQLLGQPVIGSSGKPLVGFLEPYAEKIGLVNTLTMGFMSLYASIAFSVCYARVYKLDQLTTSILGISTFLLANIDRIIEGNTITIANFGASAMFVAMITSFFSGWVYKTCLKKNIVIKMPKGVPPGISNAFSALIPFAITFFIAWFLRTILSIDMTQIFVKIFQPIFSAADNVFVFTFRIFIALAFWGVGIHGDNILGGIIDPLKLMWIAENAEAAKSGIPLTELPNIWTTGLERSVMYVASLWGLVFWLYLSKRKNNRILAVASTPASIFCIIEPIVFGLPVIMNPVLIVPWILSGTIASFTGYLLMMTGFINRFFIELPWATPPPIIAVLGTGGDWKALLLVIQAFIIGVIVYYPFVKALEKQQEIGDHESSTSLNNG